jgi:hypothetical protein
VASGDHDQWSLAVTSIYYHGRKKQKDLAEILDQEGLPFKPWKLDRCVSVLTAEKNPPQVLGALRMAIADIVRNRSHLGDSKYVDDHLKPLADKYCAVAGVNAAVVPDLLGIRDADPDTAYFKALEIMHKAEDPHETVATPFANYKARRHG